MAVFIFVTNVKTVKDYDHIKSKFDNCTDIICWTIDLTDDEKVLRVVSDTLARCEIINLVRSYGYDCYHMEW